MSTRLEHKTYARLKQLCQLRGFQGEPPNVWLVGPVGSGKTSAAAQVARDLGLPFRFNGAIDNEYKLRGFIDAQGRLISPPFRQAFEHGGVYLFDECDASMPGAVLAFNSALANGACDFPDGEVARHPDCIIIAAANTWGQGATHAYVGRMKQDAAFLDRFVQLEWGYDEDLEHAISRNRQWSSRVQAIRAAIAELGIQHIVSPRASYWGAVLLAAGVPEDQVLAMKVRGSLDDKQWREVLAEEQRWQMILSLGSTS
jgi:cobaltochelatase CobS